MKTVTRLEDTLNGKWPGLYGEVVTHDCYRVKALPFVPDVVFDIGANVGTFTRLAQSLWPKVPVLSVEPDFTNRMHFSKFTKVAPNSFLCPGALGTSLPVYRGTTAANGSGETYLSPMLGYPGELLQQGVEAGALKPAPEIKTYTLEALGVLFWCPKKKLVLKIDCEGSENCIWEHPGSMEVMKRAAYIAMELHDYGITHAEREKVLAVTQAGLRTLEETHNCERDGVHFWAIRKDLV